MRSVFQCGSRIARSLRRMRASTVSSVRCTPAVQIATQPSKPTKRKLSVVATGQRDVLAVEHGYVGGKAARLQTLIPIRA
ncbi:MAG: hypothetical protein MUF54_21320 [Polyangiaceae bacterium]|nr:hypothetical protein [Polyangiaceae bacterium]